MPKFFISYVYEDRAYKSQLASWASSGEFGNAEAVYELEDVRQGGEKAIRKQISPLIQSAQAVVVLVGDNSHNHPWLDYEVQNAKSAGKLIVSVRIPNTNGGPPAGAPSPNVTFSPSAIRTSLANVC